MKTKRRVPSPIMSGGVRIPPHSYEAEESVLGSLLIDENAIIKIADFLDAEDFYKTSHQTIYTAMVELYVAGEPLDVLSVINRLKERGELTKIGGEVAVTHLATVVPTAGHVTHYARIVQGTATRRRLISAASDITEMGFTEKEEVQSVLDTAEQALFLVSKDFKHQKFIKISEALEDAFVRIDKLQKGEHALRGVSTGFRQLDFKLSGWQKSDLIVLAARPSVGKTTLALDFARHAAASGVPVGIFSLEMSKDQLVDRLLASHAHVDLWKLRTGRLEPGAGEFDDFSRLAQAMSELSALPIYIDDHASNNVMGMRTMARRLQADHGLGLLVIDYLQLMESSRYQDNRVQEVSDISRSLKKLAIELDVPIIALSQLNRAVEMRVDQRPKLSDLRESGCLTAETQIVRADTGERVSIKSLAERKQQQPIPVFALDKHYKVVVRPMIKVFPSGKKQVYQLHTRSGRSIRASANHPFQTIDGWKALEKLSAGMQIALPRSLKPELPVNRLSGDELALLAHLIGDGCTVPRQPIHYTSADEVNLQTVENAARELFGITPRRVQQKNWWHVYLPSPYHLTHGRRHPITRWLIDLGVGLRHAWEKIVPEAVFVCNTGKIAFFLHHLWATDGNISWKRLPGRKPSAAIYYATTSQQLAVDVQHLLLRLGIQSTIRCVPQGVHRDNYQVHIQGRDMQLRFLQSVNSAGGRGEIKLELQKSLNTIAGNPNTDIIPREIWRSTITTEKERVGMSWRTLSAGINTAYAGSTLFKAGLGRERMARVATVLQSTRLHDLATSDVYWDEIILIDPQGIEEVYDATVPGIHNFVANDIIVHNSIEQDSDVVMFLHRQLMDKGEPGPGATMDIDLLIEKHRNGPTGEVNLRFHTSQVTFAEPAEEYAVNAA